MHAVRTGRTLCLAALLLASIPAAPPLAHAQALPSACRGAARPSRRMWRARRSPLRTAWSPPREAKATRIGVAILERGGNAVDAAVAVGFALAVTLPRAGNLGGGGFIVHLAEHGETVAIDYRETAPAAASPDMFLDERGEPDPRKSRDLGLSVGVPGTVRGLAMAHERYGSGRFTLAELIAPAERLAREGHWSRTISPICCRAPPAGSGASRRPATCSSTAKLRRRRAADPARPRRDAGGDRTRGASAPSTRDRSLKKSPPPSATPAAS